MADEVQLTVEQRMDRLEQLLHTILDESLWQIIHRPPPGDPAVTDLTRAQLATITRRPPRGDPPALDLVRARLQEIMGSSLRWFADPPPEDFLNVRVLDLIRRYRGGFTDPAPEDLGTIRLRDLLARIPGGGISDPAPEDLARLTTVELETHLHRINAELTRLESLRGLFRQRLDNLRQG